MKKIIALLLAAMMVFSLAACGGNANANANANATTAPAPASTEAAAAATEATEAAAPANNDIVVAAASLGSTLNPWDQTDATTAAFQYGLYDRLVKYGFTTDENGNTVADTSKMVGNLAESWETSEDGNTWTFHLNPNATYANGDKVTASDVKWSYEKCSTNANSSFFFGLTHIEEVEVVDDETVVMHLSSPSTMFLRLLEIYSFCIVNQAQAEAEAAAAGVDVDAYLTTNACGSGPYTLDTYDTTSQVKVVKRADYWNDDCAQNDSITYILQAEATERQLLLENGDVDIALDIQDRNVADLANNEALQVRQFASNKHLFMSMNMNDEYFSNPLVRKAVAYAIPYDTLVDDIMYGNAVRSTSYMPDNVSGHIAEEGVTYVNTDLDKAKELLAEAGYPNGFDCTMTLGDGFTDWEESAVTIQASLAQIGINMTINKIARAEFLQQAAGKGLQLFLNRFNPFIGDPGYLTNCVWASGADFNYNNYNNPEFDALHEKGEVSLDAAERLGYYEEAQRIYGEDCPAVQLYQYGFAFCAQKGINGYAYYPDGALHYYTLSK